MSSPEPLSPAAAVRARASGAMLRTRAAILEAAADCVERSGVRRTTMSEVAVRGRVAKATLYNHFRTKDDVLAALVQHRLALLAEECEAVAAGDPPRPELGRGLAAALVHASSALASSRPLRRVAAEEPETAARLAAPGEGPGWQEARAAAGRVLAAAGGDPDGPAVELVLRWLAGQVLWPAEGEQAAYAAAALAGHLGQEPARPVAVPAGLGWPA